LEFNKGVTILSAATISGGYGSEYIVYRSADGKLVPDMVVGSLYDEAFRKHFIDYLNELPDNNPQKKSMIEKAKRIETDFENMRNIDNEGRPCDK